MKTDKMPLVMFEKLNDEGRLKTWLRRIARRPRKYHRVMLPIPATWKGPNAGQTYVAARGVPVRLPQDALRVAALCPPHFQYRFRIVADGASRNQPCPCGCGEKAKRCTNRTAEGAHKV